MDQNPGRDGKSRFATAHIRNTLWAPAPCHAALRAPLIVKNSHEAERIQWLICGEINGSKSEA
jgi:hypothetical protein